MKRINELNVSDMLYKIRTSTYQIKYIKGVGYIFLGEGYLILSNGKEPTHYFLHHVFENPEDAKSEIIKKYQKKIISVIYLRLFCMIIIIFLIK